MNRFRRQIGLFLLPCLVALIPLSLPDCAWAFYSFQDDFGNSSYTDKWNVTATGTANVSEAGGRLDVSMTAAGGSCSTAVARSTTPVALDGGIAATTVLRPAAGAFAGMMLKKDDNNFVMVVIGPENVVIGNRESGQYVERVVGGSASYLGKDTEVEFWACQFGQLVVSINGASAGEVANLALDTGVLSLELINSYCAASPSTRHVYYDSVAAGEMFCYVPGRMTGRVTDHGTGMGIPFASVTTDSGGGVTSPNGYYVVSPGEAAVFTATVSADGYSPQRASVSVPATGAAARDWSLDPACPSSVSPGGVLLGAAGGQGSLQISMTQQAGCGTNWLAAVSDAWLALTSADFGTGSGSLAYAVQAGTGQNWRNGTIEITGHAVRIAQEGSLKAAVPAGPLAWVYSPVVLPVFDINPGQARPFAAGDLTGGFLDMAVGLPGFAGPVDIYLGFRLPEAISTEIWIILPDLGVQPLSQGLSARKKAARGPLYEGIFGKIPLSLLPAGTYELYTLVTPPNRFDSFLLWQTQFTLP